MRSTMYKNAILFAGNCAVKISSVACGLSTIKINYSVYPKSFIKIINEDCVFFKSDILLKKTPHKLHL